jgi:AraC-like DNA-binding protein
MSVIQFIVAQKIERVKELLLYDDILLPDIANHLRYKSERHLIAQFKKITGLTPYHFMKLKEERAKVILQSLQESEKKKSVKIKPAS